MQGINSLWFRKIFLVVLWGLECREVVRIINEDVQKPVEMTDEVLAIQIVVFATLLRVERKRKWMDAADIVKIESRELVDHYL